MKNRIQGALVAVIEANVCEKPNTRDGGGGFRGKCMRKIEYMKRWWRLSMQMYAKNRIHDGKLASKFILSRFSFPNPISPSHNLAAF
ncbi:hypothetical protein [Paenibacillus segetis]|uniref:hypothetical protein n=1 Tax=Paenibacillus segetis TaxID=1325360 RepID=UPI0016686A57|nr:hypothetical protein [Paenibacillus segetis]